jgi:hypothetical protein
MAKEIWINLAVKDVLKSKDFFEAIGFKVNEARTSAQMAAVSYGSNVPMVMLFPENTIKHFTGAELADPATASVLFSFGADTREEVDETAQKVTVAGGQIYSQPTEIDGWMYSFSFSDLDGHRWNMLHMKPRED